MTMTTLPNNGEKDRPIHAVGLITVDQLAPNPKHNPGFQLNYANRFNTDAPLKISLLTGSLYSAITITEALEEFSGQAWTLPHDQRPEGCYKKILLDCEEHYEELYGERTLHSTSNTLATQKKKQNEMEVLYVDSDDDKGAVKHEPPLQERKMRTSEPVPRKESKRGHSSKPQGKQQRSGKTPLKAKRAASAPGRVSASKRKPERANNLDNGATKQPGRDQPGGRKRKRKSTGDDITTPPQRRSQRIRESKGEK
jgi:hypothetical protein